MQHAIASNNQALFQIALENHMNEYMFEQLKFAMDGQKHNIIGFILDHVPPEMVIKNTIIQNKLHYLDILFSKAAYQTVSILALGINTAALHRNVVAMKNLLYKPLIRAHIQDIFILLCRDNKMEGANALVNNPIIPIQSQVILKTIEENHERAFDFMIQHFQLDYGFHHQEPLRLACRLQRIPMIILLCRLPQVDPKIIDLQSVSDVVQFTLIRARYRRRILTDIDELNLLYDYKEMLNEADIEAIRIPIQVRFSAFQALPNGPDKKSEAVYLNGVQRYLTQVQQQELIDYLSHHFIIARPNEQRMVSDVMGEIFKFRGTKHRTKHGTKNGTKNETKNGTKNERI